MTKRFLLLIFLCSLAILTNAQKGFIRGTVFEETSGLPSIGATVVIKGTTNGVITDFDGKYSLEIDPGTYTIVISYVSFATQEISDVTVASGKATIINAKLKDEAITGETFTITAVQAKNSDGAMQTVKRKSVNLLDGASSETFKKVGANDAGDALKIVTGVSVQNGGKEVFVRGLGDRYSKTILNGITIPGLDPDKNSVQVDIFPTNVIDNIIVYKSFSPDLPGDFTGGIVDIVTKDFPESRVIASSVSLGYNPAMNFQNNFLSYTGSSNDIFANGANDRALPINSHKPIPRLFISDEENQDLERTTKAFSRELSTQTNNSLLNQNYSFSIGDQLKIDEKNTFGYTVALGYRNNYKFYEEVFFNRYEKAQQISVDELELTDADSGSIGTQDILWNTLLSTSLKRKNSKYSVTFFHTQNGIKTGSNLVQTSTGVSSTPGAILDKTILYYNQRSISNLLFNTKQVINKNLEVTAAISPSLALNKEPDLRQTFFTVEDDGSFTLNNGDGALINRTYRNLEEINWNAKADAKWTFKGPKGLNAFIKAGFNYVYRKRDFDVVQYIFRDIVSGTYSGEPDDLFTDANLFNAETSLANLKGIYVIGQIDSSNIYSANMNIFSGYLMNDLALDSSLKVTYGARIEKSVLRYTGQKQSATLPEDFFNNDVVLDELDVLPAISLIYNITKDVNLRASYTSTLARPSFKEKSGAQIYDAVTQRTFIGNLDLEETKIANYDIRLEKYIGIKDIVSLSGFFKNFNNPIELVAFSPESPDNITPRNVDNAKVFGVEFEFKKNLLFLSKKLENFSLGGNATFASSSVTMSESEFLGRSLTLREGETLDRTRAFQGQAPYTINTFIGFSNYDKGLDVNLSYNVQGKNLAIVGISRIPDVFSSPFHNITIKGSKFLDPDPEKRRHKVSLTIRNLLGDRKDQVYSSFNTDDVLFSSFRESRTFSISYSFSINK